MKVLGIYGAGGMGREISELAQRIDKWNEIVFIDDRFAERTLNGFPVFSLEEARAIYDNDAIEFIVATGEPSTRRALYDKLSNKGLNYVKIMSPEFVLSKYSSVSPGTIIHSGAIVTTNVHFGVGCLVNKHVIIGHDVTVGDYCVISPNATIGGNVKIGDNCYIGSGALIRNGISIGEDSIIGMGAVVLEDVKPNSVMVGNPARLLRKNEDGRIFR